MVPIILFGQKDKKLVLKTLGPNEMKAHVYFLASDALKGRDTPSEGQLAAAEYIKTRFMEYGVKQANTSYGYLQPVPLKKTAPMTKGEIKIGGKTLVSPTDFVMVDAKNQNFSAPYLFVNYGMQDDYEKFDVNGKVAVALCGNGEDSSPRAWFGLRNEKRALAKKAGATGLIEVYHSTQMPWRFITSRIGGKQVVLEESGKGVTLPHFWLNGSDSRFVQTIREGGNVDIETKGIKNNNFSTFNVVGMVEGTDPNLKDEYIVYSAHYDHVGVGRADARGDSIYNGARDNAVGTAAILSIAENIAQYPTKRSALFVLFTGEEKGLLGSKWFVDNAPVPLNKIAYCFNIDGAGYNNKSVITVIGLERTTAGYHMEKACASFSLKAIKDGMPQQNLFDRSDNVNFAKKGIPAPTFSLGITAFDEAITKYYHQTTDNPETLDYEYINKYCKAFMYSCRLIANDKKKPFWVKGDKYFEAGTKLYDMQ